ncbi:NAD(P)/FAD-dependent oxidoreductase [Acidobacteriota bacterium]
MSKSFSLGDGSRIAIIGGGPAGAFFAHFAQKYAEEMGLNITVTIFDGKDFLQKGPKGCNLCAGVIAESLNVKLRNEGIFLPDKRIINQLEGYFFHAEGRTLHLSHTDNKTDRINTVFRGNGPRFSSFPDVISFDDFIMTWAVDMGTQIVPQPVWDIAFPENTADLLTVSYGKKEAPEKYTADLVVCAFGVNTPLISKMQNLGFLYSPPKTLVTYQAEILLGDDQISRHFGNVIHVYMPKSKSIKYAMVIPKGNYITITLIGKEDASPDLLREFLELEEIQGKISCTKPHCLCYPRITISTAKNPFTDRLVMVGDASFSRHYKNGIESAFLTAQLAAEASFKHGVDSHSLRTYYIKPAKKKIRNDNRYGRLLFKVNDIISARSILTHAHFNVAERKDSSTSNRMRTILWNMFTGNIPYKDILKISLNFRLQISLLWTTLCLSLKKIFLR